MSRNVPIHGRPMIGMNPHENNRPNLTASERIRNKRDKTIYQAEKQRFQAHKSCGNRNVRYYENGRIRNMQSYKIQQSLARGSVLCEDCDDKGLLCGDVAKSNFAKFNMGNNDVSEFWGGGGVQIVSSGGGSVTLVQTPGFPVIDADISGTWDPTPVGQFKGGISTINSINCPYGYASNVINMTPQDVFHEGFTQFLQRNSNGLGIVIDPSNLLFSDGPCLNSHFNNYSELKTWLVVTGAVPIFYSASPVPPIPDVDRQLYNPGNCNDISYNALSGSYITGWAGAENESQIAFSGVILNLCCKREQEMTYFDSSYNNANSITTQVGIFDTYIQLFSILQPDILTTWVNSTPTMHKEGSNYFWQWNPSEIAPHMLFKVRDPSANGFWRSNFIESIKVIQGTIPPYLNQTTGNNTKQDYMSCLDDGTRKINFTKNTTKKENIIRAYCETFKQGPRGAPGYQKK